jgi:hypothetical protein
MIRVGRRKVLVTSVTPYGYARHIVVHLNR